MALNSQELIDNVASVCMATGLFERVNQHEPKSAPGNGLSAAVWAQTISPSPRFSGLSETAARVEFMIRIYSNMLQEPQDAIDPNVMGAVDALMAAFSGDFQLDASVFVIDLLGMAGNPLSAKAGYLNQDGKLFRVMDIVCPLVIDNVWSQVP